MSARSWVPAWVYNDTTPPTPTLTETTFGMFWPAEVTLMLEAVGRRVPAGQIVTNPGAVAAAAVTLRTTAPIPAAGAPPLPATVRSMLLPAATPDPANSG